MRWWPQRRYYQHYRHIVVSLLKNYHHWFLWNGACLVWSQLGVQCSIAFWRRSYLFGGIFMWISEIAEQNNNVLHSRFTVNKRQLLGRYVQWIEKFCYRTLFIPTMNTEYYSVLIDTNEHTRTIVPKWSLVHTYSSVATVSQLERNILLKQVLLKWKQNKFTFGDDSEPSSGITVARDLNTSTGPGYY